MPIAIDFAPSRSKKIAVDVVPAEWQKYIEQ
ncbi:CorA-like protein [Candidatus Saccharibacteria bacterium RAAC3_TM7_1]|nr:CorA-like protein [Candidatus Saccharibacteria bacterium RAAC3_TM7_1]